MFGSFDLVLCRNVLIYFALELQDRVLDKLLRSLDKGGHLILGELNCKCLTAEDGRQAVKLDPQHLADVIHKWTDNN